MDQMCPDYLTASEIDACSTNITSSVSAYGENTDLKENSILILMYLASLTMLMSSESALLVIYPKAHFCFL